MIEITHSSSRYTYRVTAEQPLIIQRRLNRHNARWADWRLFSSADEAKAAMIKLRKHDDGVQGGDV